jgi:TonB family protein
MRSIDNGAAFRKRYSIAGLVTVATLSSMALGASTFRGPRLGACLLASVGLHFALIVPLLRPPRVENTPPALLVRFVAQTLPAPERARPPAPRKPQPASEDHPMVSAKSPWARRVPVAPVAPPLAASDAPTAPHYVPSVAVHPAYAEFGEGVQAEKLDENQRRVPRASELLRAPEAFDPIRPSYPRAALERGLRGQVLLEVFIGAGGAVDDIVVIEDSGRPELADAAAQAVRRTTFRPAEGAAGATKSRMTLRIVFTYE